MVKHLHQSSRTIHLFISVIVIFILVTACAPNTPMPTPTATATLTPEASLTPTQTATPRPTPTATLPPLGSPGNPITIGFILSPDTSAEIAAGNMADLISEETGYVLEALFYPDFQSLSAAIIDGDVHLFWLGPFEYLYLFGEGAAEVFLMTNHLGVFAYGVQFMTHVQSGFTPYFDPETNRSFGDMLEALQQFSGTRPCFIDPNSIPGYYVPMGLLANASTPTLDPVFTYNYNAIIRALYIQGICDVGVSYALTGDPLTSSDIQFNLPDAPEQITVIWQSEGIIPNINLSAAPALPVPNRFRIEEALLRIADTPEGLNLYSTALAYDVEALRPVDDSFYDPFRSAIIPLDLDLQTLTHQSMQP